jgi:hypothetical protein
MALLFVINAGRPIESDELARLRLSERIVVRLLRLPRPAQQPHLLPRSRTGAEFRVGTGEACATRQIRAVNVKTLTFGVVLR